MEGVVGGVRGGTAGCSSAVCLRGEEIRKTAGAGARSRRRSVFFSLQANELPRKQSVTGMLGRSGAPCPKHEIRAQQSFADASHVAFYSSGPGEERSPTAPSRRQQQITLEYVRKSLSYLGSFQCCSWADMNASSPPDGHESAKQHAFCLANVLLQVGSHRAGTALTFFSCSHTTFPLWVSCLPHRLTMKI